MTDETLRPCVFCGERLKLKMQSFTDEHYVQCLTCTVTGPNGVDIECAVIQWNTRPLEDKLLKENAHIRNQIKISNENLVLKMGELHELNEKYKKLKAQIEKVLNFCAGYISVDWKDKHPQDVKEWILSKVEKL